jgi:hypothetical protein
MSSTPVLEFILRNHKNFNARATRDAVSPVESEMMWISTGALVIAAVG